MTDSTALVAVDNLSCYYQNHCAVNQLSFSLNRGEILGFLGPNGAGKSTTMQMITGNLAPTAGEISINGFDIIDSPKQAKQHIGYLPEHPPVYPDAKVDEYLKYCAQLHRIKGPAIAAAMERAKSRCGLLDAGHRLIGNLSKGYQQRIGIAQAIIHDPCVLILDEPTVGLDPIQNRDIRTLIQSLGDERSVILSTHILSEVQATCNRVQIIRDGQSVYTAPIDTLKAHGQVRSFTVAFEHAPSIEVLQQLNQVAQVESLGEQRFRLYWHAESAIDSLVQTSVQQAWGLCELMPDRASLEDLFIELTNENTSGAEAP